MASRTIVPQQIRGNEVAGAGKQQKKNVGEGKNRRALGDIGNLVTVRGIDPKNQPQINRPLTRSFRAQLLANAQAAEKKQQVNVDKAPVPDGLAKKKATAAKAAQVRAASKPKPTEVIEISPGMQEGAKNKQQQDKANKKDEHGSSQKKVTYTSVLTARSKAAAFDLEKKPKELFIVDIDAADADNGLAGIEYVEDIYTFYKAVENDCQPSGYLHSQPEINEKMRAILVDWLIDVHLKFELSPETLYLTINIIDRFLSVNTVPRRELQLVGLGALLISSKYEEIWPPQVTDLVYISDHAYSQEQILKMEKTVLAKLEWYLTVPTHYVFLARFIKASIPDKETENMVHFLAELAIMHYDTLEFSPSMVAASAVYAARYALKKSPAWTDTLKHHTGYAEAQLMDCAKLVAYFHSQAAESKLRAAYRKYSKDERGAVALIPAAKSLLSGSDSGEAVKNNK